MWQRQAESRCRCGSGEPSPRGRCGRGGPRSQSNAYRQAFCGVGLRRLCCRRSAAACAACPRAIAMACQRAARPIPAARSDARSGPNGMRRPLWATSVRASAGRFRDSGRHALWLAAIFRTSSECCVYKHTYMHIYTMQPSPPPRDANAPNGNTMPCHAVLPMRHCSAYWRGRASERTYTDRGQLIPRTRTRSEIPLSRSEIPLSRSEIQLSRSDPGRPWVHTGRGALAGQAIYRRFWTRVYRARLGPLR